MRAWQLQEAKNSLSEVVDEAQRSGPQLITRRGLGAAVVLSFEQWQELARQRTPLIEVLRRAPRIRGGLDVERSKDTGRDVKF